MHARRPGPMLCISFMFSIAFTAVFGLAYAEPAPFNVEGYTFTLKVPLSVEPATAYDVMTGDVTPWWDHTMSEEPYRMYIEPKAGGSFLELFNETGQGVEHAHVTYARRGKLLRMVGPLGLAGRAFYMVTTWTYEATDNGCSVTCLVNMIGQVDHETARTVERVWEHFLIEQLQPYIESGAYKEELDSP
ncbi:SRPBCC domain-containing protein [bacterium]|nr:SRPBCC domain-containing protein [bacterium]